MKECGSIMQDMERVYTITQTVKCTEEDTGKDRDMDMEFLITKTEIDMKGNGSMVLLKALVFIITL